MKEIIDFVKPQTNENVIIKNVGPDKYRVNIFSSHFVEDSVIKRTTLSKSYYVKVDGDKVTDLTI